MINKSSGSDVRPFAGLTPDLVLDAAAAFGFESDGRFFALNSYENRVYQLGRADSRGAWVLKFYRPRRWSDAQILEEHEFAAELAAAELPVAAPESVQGQTLFRYGSGPEPFRFAVFPWMRGRAPEMDAPGARQILGRTIARMHQVGARRPFRTRPAIAVERLGKQARTQVLESGLLPDALVTSYGHATRALLDRIERAFDAAGDITHIRIHGDCHLGNLLWDEHGPIFVDLDDCVMGPRIQDLWMLLSGSAEEQQRQWSELLEGYQQFADFDFRELTLIESLRGLRMLNHAAWIAQRWDDPAFPRAFPYFGEQRYWERHISDLLEQIALIEDPPLMRG
ncbi:MAG TPA: serine/threonine protein kinase [Steroidobacteraceae bacterium]